MNTEPIITKIHSPNGTPVRTENLSTIIELVLGKIFDTQFISVLSGQPVESQNGTLEVFAAGTPQLAIALSATFSKEWGVPLTVEFKRDEPVAPDNAVELIEQAFNDLEQTRDEQSRLSHEREEERRFNPDPEPEVPQRDPDQFAD